VLRGAKHCSKDLLECRKKASHRDIEGLAISGVGGFKHVLGKVDDLSRVLDHVNVRQDEPTLTAIGVLEGSDQAKVVGLPSGAEALRVGFGSLVEALVVLESVGARVLHEGEVAEGVGEAVERNGEFGGKDVATAAVRSGGAEVLVDGLEEVGLWLRGR
jgi:hypothetical protein